MEVIANGQKIPFEITDEKNLTEILSSILSLTNKADKLVFECKCNGNVISLLDRTKYKDVNLPDIERIELLVGSKSEHLRNALADVENVFDSLGCAFSGVADALIGGQKHKALAKFSETLQQWRKIINFLRVIEASVKISFKEMMVDGKSVEVANEELFKLLLDIKGAIEVEDLVTISDLVEYELKDKIVEQKKICQEIAKTVKSDIDELVNDSVE